MKLLARWRGSVTGAGGARRGARASRRSRHALGDGCRFDELHFRRSMAGVGGANRARVVPEALRGAHRARLARRRRPARESAVRCERAGTRRRVLEAHCPANSSLAGYDPPLYAASTCAMSDARDRAGACCSCFEVEVRPAATLRGSAPPCARLGSPRLAETFALLDRLRPMLASTSPRSLSARDLRRTDARRRERRDRTKPASAPAQTHLADFDARRRAAPPTPTMLAFAGARPTWMRELGRAA